MHFTVDLANDPPNDWKKFLLESETGTISNTAEYAEYAKRWIRWKPIFLRLIDSKGNVVLQNLLFEYGRGLKIPHTFRNLYQKFNKILRWNYGPIATSQDSMVYFFEYIKSTKRKIYETTHPLSSLLEI